MSKAYPAPLSRQEERNVQLLVRLARQAGGMQRKAYRASVRQRNEPFVIFDIGKGCAPELPHRLPRRVIWYRKDDGSPATNFDFYIDWWIRKELKKARPHWGIDSEEVGGSPVETTCRVVVDTIDGTQGLRLLFDILCFMIVLCRNGEPHVGVVYDAALDCLAVCVAGGKTFCDGKPVGLSRQATLDGASLILEISDLTLEDGRDLGHLLSERKSKFCRLYGMGAPIIRLLLGRADAVFSYSMDDWDRIPAEMLANGAGAQILAIKKGRIFTNGNPSLGEEIKALL